MTGHPTSAGSSWAAVERWHDHAPRADGVRRRAAPSRAQRIGPRPDRIALWAVLLGIFLILVAITSS